MLLTIQLYLLTEFISIAAVRSAVLLCIFVRICAVHKIIILTVALTYHVKPEATWLTIHSEHFHIISHN